VTLGRGSLIWIPVPSVDLLWHDRKLRVVRRVGEKYSSNNILMGITVKGISEDRPWQCGLEFDYANPEFIYCRPMRLEERKQPARMPIPDEALKVRVAYLPPMSGLTLRETKLERGAIDGYIGEGQTAQILRNLCYQIYEPNEKDKWSELTRHIHNLFGLDLLPPVYNKVTSEITMEYKERGVKYDISSSGRGLQQTLLLMSHLYANPGTVLLLDEPDAHLEILRQRQSYRLLSDIAHSQGSQLIAASHSEVVLNEAAGRDTVVAFIGIPHPLMDRGGQLRKSLSDINWEHYYNAELKGWVLYLEGSTDLAILKKMADILDHPAGKALDDVFVEYVGNLPSRAESHFRALSEAFPGLKGLAIFDRLDMELAKDERLRKTVWRKREIENYICNEKILLAFARYDLPEDDLFGKKEADDRVATMQKCINELVEALKITNRPNPWSPDIKVTDEFLDPLFNNYFQRLGLENVIRKSSYYVLTQFLTRDDIDSEIVEKLDMITETALECKRD